MQILTFIQIAVAAALIVLILLQERSAGMSGIFGGETGTPYQTRRGMERVIFISTIALAVVFVGLSLFKLVV